MHVAIPRGGCCTCNHTLKETMNTTRTTIAADINRFHELACLRAGEAIEHAKQAGFLLLEAKAAMKHGEWLPWLEQNIQVSARQVQRYMQVAQGRPLPIRATPAKNDKVTHLEVDAPRLFPFAPDTPGFVPEVGLCFAHSPVEGILYLVEPSRRHPGFFFVSRLEGHTHDCTRRPIAAEWVETNLRYFGMESPAAVEWMVKESPGVLTAMDTFEGTTTAWEGPHRA